MNGVKTFLLWAVIIVLVLLLWNLFAATKGTTEQIGFSKFINEVNAGKVEKVVIRGTQIEGTWETAASPVTSCNRSRNHTTSPPRDPGRNTVLPSGGIFQSTR